MLFFTIVSFPFLICIDNAVLEHDRYAYVCTDSHSFAGLLTLMHAQTDLHYLPLCTSGTNKKRGESMKGGFGKWSVPLLCPSVMSGCGGLGKAASALFKRIAVLIARRIGESYLSAMAFIRCKLSFSLLRSCIMRFCGSRRLADSSIATVTSSSLAVVEAPVSL